MTPNKIVDRILDLPTWLRIPIGFASVFFIEFILVLPIIMAGAAVQGGGYLHALQMSIICGLVTASVSTTIIETLPLITKTRV